MERNAGAISSASIEFFHLKRLKLKKNIHPASNLCIKREAIEGTGTGLHLG